MWNILNLESLESLPILPVQICGGIDIQLSSEVDMT